MPCPASPNNPSIPFIRLGLGLLASLLLGQSGAIASDFPPPRDSGSCPTDLDTLLPYVLRDLPSYANRVIQRSRVRSRSEDISGYILLASPPDLDDLPFALSESPFPETLLPQEGDSPSSDSVRQVFFTTLERQYGISGFAQLQAHHRAFLTPTNQGWQLVLMQSSLQAYPGTSPPAPPRDNSYGVIAQALQLWFRDCQAEAIDLGDRPRDSEISD